MLAAFPPQIISYVRSACPSVAPVSNRCLPSRKPVTLFKLVISPLATSAFSAPIGFSATCGGLSEVVPQLSFHPVKSGLRARSQRYRRRTIQFPKPPV